MAGGVAPVLGPVLAALAEPGLVAVSSQDGTSIRDGTFCSRRWTLERYRGVCKASGCSRALVTSIGIGIISTVIAVVLASVAA